MILKYIVNFAIFPGNNIAYKKQIEIELYSCILSLQIQNLKILREVLQDIENRELVKKYAYRLKQIRIELSIFGEVLTTSSNMSYASEAITSKISNAIETLKNTTFIDKANNQSYSLWSMMDDTQALLSICMLTSVRRMGYRKREIINRAATNSKYRKIFTTTPVRVSNLEV